MPVSPTSPIETTLEDREGVLQACIQTLVPDPDPEGPGRPRVLPALALWAGLWVCLLRGFKSHLALWRLLCKRGLGFFPRFSVTDQAVYNRLAKADLSPLARLFRPINTVLADRYPHQNEKVAARAFVADLLTETLILADLGYFGLFDWLTAKNEAQSVARQDEL